jgi:hypothetical protein
MNDSRRNALAAGVLFIIATVAGLLAASMTKPILSEADYLARIAGNGTPMFVGALLKFVCAAASAGIALALYPVLRRYAPGLALGSVAFRLVEGSFYAIGAAGTLLLVTLSQEAAKAGPVDASLFGHAAVLLLAGCDWVGFVGAVLFFGLGGLLYYWVLFQTALVPRWLSGWGLVAAALCMMAAVLVLFQVTTPASTPHILLNLPIFLQEMVLAVWLIAKGFDARAIAMMPASDATAPAGVPALSAKASA